MRVRQILDTAAPGVLGRQPTTHLPGGILTTLRRLRGESLLSGLRAFRVSCEWSGSRALRAHRDSGAHRLSRAACAFSALREVRAGRASSAPREARARRAFRAHRAIHVRRVRSRCRVTLRSTPMRSALLTPVTVGIAAPADGLQGGSLRQRLGVPRRHLSILHLSAISSSPPTNAPASHLLSPPSRPRAQASSTLNRTQLHR